MKNLIKKGERRKEILDQLQLDLNDRFTYYRDGMSLDLSDKDFMDYFTNLKLAIDMYATFYKNKK